MENSVFICISSFSVMCQKHFLGASSLDRSTLEPREIYKTLGLVPQGIQFLYQVSLSLDVQLPLSFSTGSTCLGKNRDKELTLGVLGSGASGVSCPSLNEDEKEQVLCLISHPPGR